MEASRADNQQVRSGIMMRPGSAYRIDSSTVLSPLRQCRQSFRDWSLWRQWQRRRGSLSLAAGGVAQAENVLHIVQAGLLFDDPLGSAKGTICKRVPARGFVGEFQALAVR